MTVPSTARPTSSPWGPIQEAHQEIPGVWWVSTASHGGYILSAERQQAMPPALRGPTVHYEEDLDYIRVWLAFRDELAVTVSAEQYDAALITMKNWLPDEYQAHFAIGLQTGDSFMLERRARIDACIGKLCVKAAIGHGRDTWIPVGMVGLVGAIVTGRAGGNPCFAAAQTFGICRAAHYRNTFLLTFDELGATIVSPPAQ